jgi:ABC-type nitrate/sulfonate/bicarbonate transport system permease component
VTTPTKEVRAVQPTLPAAAGPSRWSWASWPRSVHAGLGALIIVIAWYLVAEFGFRRSGSVPTPPAVLWQMLTDLGDGSVWKAIRVTCAEAAEGYAAGNLLALAAAAIVLLVPWLEGIVTQVAVIASGIPLTAIAPLIVLMSATSSHAAAVVLAGMGVFYTTVIGSLVGLRAADPTALDIVAVYGGGRWTRLCKVQVITALPNVLSSLRIAAPAAFVGALLGEFFLSGVDSGLGIMIEAAQIHYGPTPLWALALLSAAVAGVAYAVVSVVARLLTPWSGDGSARGGV